MDDAPRLRSETITLALRTLCRRATTHHPRKDPTRPTPLPPTFRRSGRCDRGPVVRERAGPAAEKVGGTTGHHRPRGPGTQKPPTRDWASDLGLRAEPPVGIEPTTYSLRVD